MAKKIESTPPLTGEDADKFLKDMAHPENITDKERKLFIMARKMKLQIK